MSLAALKVFVIVIAHAGYTRVVGWLSNISVSHHSSAAYTCRYLVLQDSISVEYADQSSHGRISWVDWLNYMMPSGC